MKYVVLGVICLVFLAQATDQSNEIDVVQNLLNDLRNNAQSELNTLEQSHASTKQRKSTVIDQLSLGVQRQRGECNNRDQDVANKERDITITLSFINWLEKRIKENTNRVNLLDQVRCRSNSNFIQDSKHNKMTLNLIQFLRRAIQSASEHDLPSLLQTTNLKPHLENFLRSQEKISLLLQLRSSQEENSDESSIEETLQLMVNDQVETEVSHENNEQVLQATTQAFANYLQQEQPAGNGSSQQFSAAQQELLDILDSIEQEVRGTFSHFQDNQVNSAMGYNDFKGLVLKENEAFEHHIRSENENLDRLQNQLITVLQASASCKARLQQLNQAVNFATEDLTSGDENYNAVKERLLAEIDLFGDVARVYSNQVGSQSSQYKQDVQSRIRG